MDPQQYYQNAQLYSQQNQEQLHQQQEFQHYHLQQQQHQNRLQQQQQQQPEAQAQQHHHTMKHQQERSASNADVNSRRADRRQPIIIQNFELLQPGHAHLKRRALSTANLFLSSASLRRETEIFSNAQIVEKVLLHNSPDNAARVAVDEPSLKHPNRRDLAHTLASLDNSSAGELSLNHPSRLNFIQTATSQNNFSSLRHSSAWATPRDESQSLAQYTTNPENSKQKDLLSPSSSNRESSSMAISLNETKPMNNTARPQPRPIVPAVELGRAHSYPKLSTTQASPKKAKTKKQVTFADSVSIPWPYTLVREGKMWNTGNNDEEFHSIHYTDTACNGLDINNNSEDHSLNKTYQNANIFRPMPSKGKSHDTDVKETPKPYQGILKTSKTYSKNSQDLKGNVAILNTGQQIHSSRTAPEQPKDFKSKDRISVHNNLSDDGDESSSHLVKKDTSVVLNNDQISLQIHNGCSRNGTEKLVEGNRGYSSVDSSANLQYLQTREQVKNEFNGDPNGILSTTGENFVDSGNVNSGSINDTNFLREDVERRLCNDLKDNVKESFDKGEADSENQNNFPGNLISEETSSPKADCDESQPPKDNVPDISHHIERNPEVTGYTVPQLVDSIDLSDYLSNLSQPRGISGKQLIPAAFRPGTNNARLFPKPDSSRSTVGPLGSNNATDDNGKVRSMNANQDNQANHNSASIMRLKFLKDEPVLFTKKGKNGHGNSSGTLPTKCKLEDFNNLAIKISGKSLELCPHPTTACVEDQNSSEENRNPLRPVKPFNGKPGEAYLVTGSANRKTQGDINTDFLMQMYSSTGERQIVANRSRNKDDTETFATSSPVELHNTNRNNIPVGIDTAQRPHSSVTSQRPRLAATVTSDPDWSRGQLTGNEAKRRPRESSRRDLQNRKLAVTREDAHAFTPRSRERQRRLLTASLVGEPAGNLDLEDGANLTPRAVAQARARSSSASASATGRFRGRNLSAHERTLGAMESAFMPDRQKSARGGARGNREGVVYTTGRTQLNRRLEMLVLSSTRPNTALERSRSNLS